MDLIRIDSIVKQDCHIYTRYRLLHWSWVK